VRSCAQDVAAMSHPARGGDPYYPLNFPVDFYWRNAYISQSLSHPAIGGWFVISVFLRMLEPDKPHAAYSYEVHLS